MKAKVYLSIKNKNLIEIIGPKKGMTSAAEKFKQVRKEVYLSKGYFCAKEKFDMDSFLKSKKETAKDMSVEFSWKRI